MNEAGFIRHFQGGQKRVETQVENIKHLRFKYILINIRNIMYIIINIIDFSPMIIWTRTPLEHFSLAELHHYYSN